MSASALSLALLALSVSLDGFGVGVAYGLRRIRIPALSVAIITGCSALAAALAMSAGRFLGGFLTPQAASAAGAAILIGIGSWSLVQCLRDGDRDDGGHAGQDEPAGDNDDAFAAGNLPRVRLLRVEIRSLGLIVHILRSPSAADADRSGAISPGEAVWLGAALSLDAFGAGIGAALIGLPAGITPLVVGAAGAGFLILGIRVGSKADRRRTGAKTMSVLPGLILIVLGFLRLF
jgi:putative sporulation protein YtaF